MMVPRAASLLLAFAWRCGAFFESGSDVVTFDSAAKWREHNPGGSNHLWIITFYREGCGHCVLLEPEFQKAATKLRKLVHFGAVDVEKHRRVSDAIVKKHGVEIKGVPTIYVFSPTAAASPFPYNGERKAGALVAFAGDHQPDFIKRVAGDDWSDAPDAFVRRVLLFTEKRSPTGLFKGLASRFRFEIDFGSVYCGTPGANEKLRARYGVEHSADLPALVVVPNDKSDSHKATKAFEKLAKSGEGYLVPIGAKPSYMKLEFALMPFAVKKPTLFGERPEVEKRRRETPQPDDSMHPEEERYHAETRARKDHAAKAKKDKTKKRRKQVPFVDSSWQDSLWDDGEL